MDGNILLLLEKAEQVNEQEKLKMNQDYTTLYGEMNKKQNEILKHL